MPIGRTSPSPFSRWIKRRLSIGWIGLFNNVSSLRLVLAIHFDNGSPFFILMSSLPSSLTAGLLLFLSLLTRLSSLPLLYVLCIEMLPCSIIASPAIECVPLPGAGRVFKCSGYADDTSIAATTDASMQATFDIYVQYERASGAKLNRGKSKGLWLGAWKDRQDIPFGIKWVKELSLLGATLSAGDYSTATWEAPVAKVEKRLSSWKGRQLTFQGKSLTPWPSPKFGTCAMFLPSRSGPRSASSRPPGFFSGRVAASWFPVVLFVCPKVKGALGSSTLI